METEKRKESGVVVTQSKRIPGISIERKGGEFLEGQPVRVTRRTCRQER
jgi:hypothetical protein